MAKADRVLERLRRLPPEMPFSEIETLLLARGWTIRQGGKPSHWILTSPNGAYLTIATKQGRSVKRTYLRHILRELD